MEERPSDNPDLRVSANESMNLGRREHYRSVWQEAHRRGQRSRVGQFLFLTFAELGVRASAQAAARSERSFLGRYLLVQRIMANWHATRRRLEHEADS